MGNLKTKNSTTNPQLMKVLALLAIVLVATNASTIKEQRLKAMSQLSYTSLFTEIQSQITMGGPLTAILDTIERFDKQIRTEKPGTTPTPELRSTTEPAPPLSPEPRSILVSTRKIRSIPSLPLPSLPPSETPSTPPSLVSKRDMSTPSPSLLVPWTSLTSSSLVKPPSFSSLSTP